VRPDTQGGGTRVGGVIHRNEWRAHDGRVVVQVVGAELNHGEVVRVGGGLVVRRTDPAGARLRGVGGAGPHHRGGNHPVAVEGGGGVAYGGQVGPAHRRAGAFVARGVQGGDGRGPGNRVCGRPRHHK